MTLSNQTWLAGKYENSSFTGLVQCEVSTNQLNPTGFARRSAPRLPFPLFHSSPERFNSGLKPPGI